MEDFYELLEIDPSWSAAEIDTHLLSLNRKYRTRTNHRDGLVREEAIARLEIVNRAMARIGPDADRTAYDQALAVFHAEQELFQPLSDVDLYQVLGIDPTMAGEQIEQLLDAKAVELEAAASSDLVLRQQKLIGLARSVLLDPEKRRRYDELMAKRAAFATERDAAKPVPLRINGASVMTWHELEAALDTHPDLGLALLQDGEIEAWLRWSLGKKQLADHVHNISQRAVRSKTPFMEQQELLRLISAQRPLVLYAPGKGPGDGDVVVVRTVAEIPRLADAHWVRFVQQSDYVIDWAAQYGTPQIADRLSQYSASDDAAIWLERLVAAIAPDHPSPELDIQGIPGLQIDFGDVSAWSTPTHTFTVGQRGRGYLYGQLRTTAPWLKLSPKAFAGKATQIVVEADRAALQSGSENQASIVIEPLDGRVAAVEIAVSVHQKTLWKSVTGLFGGKR